MNINKVSANTFCGKIPSRVVKMEAPLKNGRKFYIEHSGNDVSAFILNSDNKIIAGRGGHKPQGFSFDEIANLINRFQGEADSNTNLLDKFVHAFIGK